MFWYYSVKNYPFSLGRMKYKKYIFLQEKTKRLFSIVANLLNIFCENLIKQTFVSSHKP